MFWLWWEFSTTSPHGPGFLIGNTAGREGTPSSLHWSWSAAVGGLGGPSTLCLSRSPCIPSALRWKIRPSHPLSYPRNFMVPRPCSHSCPVYFCSSESQRPAQTPRLSQESWARLCCVFFCFSQAAKKIELSWLHFTSGDVRGLNTAASFVFSIVFFFPGLCYSVEDEAKHARVLLFINV